MEVQVVDSGPCRRSLTIKVSPEKIKRHVDDVFERVFGPPSMAAAVEGTGIGAVRVRS